MPKPSSPPESPVYVAPSRIHGTGVFARRLIHPGERIGTYEGEPTLVDGIYVLWVEQDDGGWRGVDGRNELRFLNHSLTPNAEFDGAELYALCEIRPDEELTIHYGEDWEGRP